MSILGIVLLIAAAVFIYLFNGLIIKRSRVENFGAYYTAFLKRRVEFLDELLALLPGEADDIKQELQLLLDTPRLSAPIADKSQWDSQTTAAWKTLFEKIQAAPELKNISGAADALEKIERNGGYLITARSEYNQAVENLNREITVFPWSLLAKAMKINKYEPCTVPDAEFYKPLKLTSIKD